MFIVLFCKYNVNIRLISIKKHIKMLKYSYNNKEGKVRYEII